MRSIFAMCAAMLCITTAVASDYKSDWSYVEFYQEVSTCRSAIISPAVQEYLDAGAADKHPADQLRGEVISLLPVFETSASAACYCAVNEVAKSAAYADYFGDGDFTARMTILSKYVIGGACGEKMRAALAPFENATARDAVRLH